jgi:hypothetical protein
LVAVGDSPLRLGRYEVATVVAGRKRPSSRIASGQAGNPPEVVIGDSGADQTVAGVIAVALDRPLRAGVAGAADSRLAGDERVRLESLS